jgi:two-component system chemotaxis response regulator CheB
VSARIRVLVVDDSAFARKVLREVLSAAPGIDVVGAARDGFEALEKIAELKPDVITLDLVMPGLDGPGVLRALTAPDAPRAVVVTSGPMESELAVEALRLGAVALVLKPTHLATDRLYALGRDLVEAVRVASTGRRPAPAPLLPPTPAKPAAAPRVATRRLLVIGASTGGPQALTQLLTALPAHFPVPVALVLHLPEGFTETFARRLNQECALEVVEASPGMAVAIGRVVVARAGQNLRLQRRPDGRVVAALDALVTASAHRPSVDALFESAADVFGADVLGVVLTGMGEDGLAGSRALVAAGGAVLVQDRDSCVVYGMPRAVAEAGLATAQVPIAEMLQAIMEHL